VGQLLIHAGHDFLRDVYDDEIVATSTNHLLAMLFHLFALGLLGLVSTANYPILEGLSGVQLMVTKIGAILLALGVVYGLTVLTLASVRSRLRSRVHEESIRPST